jgi:uncharacterized repeat protein (TIGR04052 family)
MKKFGITGLALVSLIASCGDSESGAGGDGGAGGEPGAGGDGGAGGASAVAIEFEAVVGDELFVCGETYDNLGANDTSLELSDLRFYVQDVELVTASGDAVQLNMDESEWQLPNLALLDFEDGCGDLGNEPTNRTISGTIASGDYVGIRFKMGVPFTENHENPSVAPSPLNLTSMHWNWQGGYKFLRIDSGSVSPTDWRMHLGSTACDGDPASGGTTMCANPNRVDVELPTFDPATDVVVFDFAALVDGAALDVNQEGTPVGCMAGPMDSDCAPLFDNLGLAFGGSVPVGPQTVFSVLQGATLPQ